MTLSQHIEEWRGEPAPRTWKFRALLVSALLLLVPHVSGALVWLYQHGGLPLKPRDWTIFFSLSTIVLALLSRPSLCLPALAIFIIPVWRLADIIFLERYTVESLEGGHSDYVMVLLGNFVVTTAAVMTLTVRGGGRIAVWFAATAILACAGVDIYEWLGYENFTRIPGRVSGFLEDPNQSPIVICLLFGVIFLLHRRFWWNMALVVPALVAVALTLSRSGMSIFAFMIGCYLMANFRRHLAGLLAAGAISIPIAAAGIAVFAESAERRGVVRDENAAGRLEAIYELDFEKLKSPERAKDLQDGWEAVADGVLFGYGTGAGSNRWQPHNQVVTLWLDNGIGALAVFAGLIAALGFQTIRTRSPAFYCLVPIVLFIPCSQILLETPCYWFVFAVACQALFPRRYQLTLAHRTAALPSPGPGRGPNLFPAS